jgi:hypothetical protein
MRERSHMIDVKTLAPAIIYYAVYNYILRRPYYVLTDLG